MSESGIAGWEHFNIITFHTQKCEMNWQIIVHYFCINTTAKCRLFFKHSFDFCIFYSFHTARAEEEATTTPTKLTNQLFVKSANNTNNLSNGNTLLNGDDSLSAATFVSVVSQK